jgi:hypothetical protein
MNYDTRDKINSENLYWLNFVRCEPGFSILMAVTFSASNKFKFSVTLKCLNL